MRLLVPGLVYTFSLLRRDQAAQPKSSSRRDIPVLKSITDAEGMEGNVRSHLRRVQADLRIICE